MLLPAIIQSTSYTFNLSQLILFPADPEVQICPSVPLLSFAIVPNSYCSLLSHAVESLKHLSAGSYLKKTCLKLDSTQINGPNRKIPCKLKLEVI